jgi:processive 1,2-diacylglycerol beta-glucosyltransferase
MKNLWVVYSSRKGGHKYPTQSIVNYLKKYHDDKFNTVGINFLDCSPIASFFDSIGRFSDLKFRKMMKNGYKSLKANRKKMLSNYGRSIRVIFKSGCLRQNLLNNFGKPDIILSIQPEVNALAGILKSWFDVPVYSVIIDLVAHGLWVNESIDYYFIPNEDMKQELLDYGVEERKIVNTGLPIREGFRKVTQKDQTALRKELGIDTKLPTILMLGGLLGKMVDFMKVIGSLSRIKMPHQLIGIFGKNAAARKKAEKIDYPYTLHPKGHIENVYDWMWASDIVVTKPGSVTIAEITSLGKPLIVITPLAGSLQETKFAELLQRKKVGEWVQKADEVGECTENLLSNPKLMEKISTNAKAFGERSLYSIDNITKFMIRKEI